ncbi:DUF3006 domain-containing protein [Haloferacaceae archaeon DSL9]
MPLDGTYRATVDRVVEGLAVVLVEADGDVVDQRDVPVETLPAGARTENAVLTLTFDADDLVDVEADPEATASRLDDARKRFERLSKRPPKRDESGADAADDGNRAETDPAADDSRTETDAADGDRRDR